MLLKKTPRSEANPLYSLQCLTILGNYCCLANLGSERVAALRLIGPFRGSRIRLSIGILLNK
jgi:hypothetical protein